MYRFICMTGDGNVVAESYRNFMTAYRRCIPDVMDDYHLMMSGYASTKLDADDGPILISWTEAPLHVVKKHLRKACWIQRIDNNGAITAFPSLVMP